MKGIVSGTFKASEDGKFVQYLTQCKQECAARLMDILFNPEWGTLDLKFWLGFAKKKFMNLEFGKTK